MKIQNLFLWGAAIYLSACSPETSERSAPAWLSSAKAKMIQTLAETNGVKQKEAIEKGVAQVSAYWRIEDGNQKDFENFIQKFYCADKNSRDQMFSRFQKNLEARTGFPQTNTASGVRYSAP